MPLPPLRYLSAADVRAAMPGVEQRLELARTAMIARIELQKPGEGVLPHENTLSGPNSRTIRRQ